MDVGGFKVTAGPTKASVDLTDAARHAISKITLGVEDTSTEAQHDTSATGEPRPTLTENTTPYVALPSMMEVNQARSVLFRFTLTRLHQLASLAVERQEMFTEDCKDFNTCSLADSPRFGCICWDVKQQARVVEELQRGAGVDAMDDADSTGADATTTIPKPAAVKEARLVLLQYQLSRIEEQAKQLRRQLEQTPCDTSARLNLSDQSVTP